MSKIDKATSGQSERTLKDMELDAVHGGLRRQRGRAPRKTARTRASSMGSTRSETRPACAACSYAEQRKGTLPHCIDRRLDR